MKRLQRLWDRVVAAEKRSLEAENQRGETLTAGNPFVTEDLQSDAITM